MVKFNPTVPVDVYKKESAYIPGDGPSAAWTSVGRLYCEWRGAYGDRVTAAQALGVSDSATIRTYYHPTIYNALRGAEVVIVKNADTTGIQDGEPDETNPNVYALWSGVDNVGEENQFMEFRVRRYESK